MAQFRLPANSRYDDRQGRHHPAPAGRRARAAVPHLPLGPGLARAAPRRHLRHRPRPLRPDGSRRAHQDQERGRRDRHVPPLLPRGHLRLLRDEHRRRQHARLHAADRRHQGRGEGLPAAAPAGREGPRARPDAVLRAVRRGRAVAQGRIGAARRRRAPPGARGPGAHRPAVGLHPVRLLLDVLPELLVELGPLPGPCGAAREPIAGSSTRATARRRSAWPSSTRRSSSIAATRS